MKLTKMMLILVAVFGIFLFASGRGYSSPITYTGIDRAPLPSTPRPNSDAAAAKFDAAAALLGPVNMITFEGLTVPSASSFTPAPGVNVAYSGDYWSSVPTATGTYYSGVNDVMVNPAWGFNTTAGGSQYLGLAPVPASTSNITASITFSFSPPIYAFGGYFSGLEMSPDTVTLNYVTVNGTYSLVIKKPTFDDLGVRFFGITDTDLISQITLTAFVPAGTIEYDWWGLDDVRYAWSSAAFKLPDTGQTLCYDSSGYVIDCAGTGQDGAYNISPMSFTENGNGTVTDKNTGLMWQKNDDGNRYNWYQASGTYNKTYNPNSQDVCGSLTLGSHSDWRLPTKKELMSIVDYSIPPPGPVIMTTYFPNTWSAWYWSSTTDIGTPVNAWYVDFYGGFVGVYGKDYIDHVRCVRGGQPSSPVFIDNGNGTVTDYRTGFMWQQGEGGTMTWSSALSYCKGLNLGGYSDWRLPNIKELESTTDDTRYNPAIDASFFPDTMWYYWSSTTDAGSPDFAWYVDFYGGFVYAYNSSKPSSFYVRCLRGYPDANPPTGSITIEGGAEATKSTAVTLTLTASDDSPGAIQMCVSNTATCTTWTAFASTKSWTLTTGDGTKTVNVWFKDGWGNINATPYSGTIILDTIAPTNGTVKATPGDTQVTLDWTGFADAGSGIESYKVVFAKGSAPKSCSTGTAIYSGPNTTYPHTGLTNGTTYYYRVCAIDKAENISSGATASAKPIPETNPPTGSITINGGAEATKSAAVTLTMTATDDSPGVIQMCVSNTTTCTKWTAFASTKRWRLTNGDGAKSVNVWFKDVWGNATPTPYSGTIILDTIAPTNGTVTATPGDAQVRLDWTGFADAGSGIESYKVVFAKGSTPTSCSRGTMIYSGTDSSYIHTGLTNGTKYGYRVCAIDKAGKISRGATANAKPQ